MPIRPGDEQKLADKQLEEEERRKRNLPLPTAKEAKVMRQVRDTDIEGDN